MKHKVIFCLVPNCSNDQWLNDKLLQITEAFVAVLNSHFNYPVHIVNNFDDVNSLLDQAEFIFVLKAGCAITNPSMILKKLHSIPPTVGLIGHILKTYQNETPFLHDQCMVINTSAYSNLVFESKDDVGEEIVRSQEDLHNGRAPAYVTLGNDVVIRNHKFGTKLIIDCLENGFEAINFDNEWRWTADTGIVSLDDINKELDEKLEMYPAKGYCYPEKCTEDFASALKHLEMVPGLDNAQQIFIASFRQALDFKLLNAWTYDIVYNAPKKNVAICPATGFFGEVAAIQSDSTKLVLYDKNPNNIQFKKDLYAYWDGKNYKDFVDNWNKDRRLKLEPVFDVDFEYKNIAYNQAETFVFPIWNEWRKHVEVSFVECDLIKDIDTLLPADTADALIYTSTILDDYPMTHVLYSREQIAEVKDKIINSGIHWLK